MNTSLKLSKQLSFGEEIANSVTHAHLTPYFIHL